MKTIDLTDVAHRAVCAALDVIDEATDGTSRLSAGPCGDDLAGRLDAMILDALRRHMASDYGPAFIRAKEGR